MCEILKQSLVCNVHLLAIKVQKENSNQYFYNFWCPHQRFVYPKGAYWEKTLDLKMPKGGWKPNSIHQYLQSIALELLTPPFEKYVGRGYICHSDHKIWNISNIKFKIIKFTSNEAQFWIEFHIQVVF